MPGEYKARVTGRYKDCLTRQVREAVLIRRSKVPVLNSKTEWHQPALFQIQQELYRGWRTKNFNHFIILYHLQVEWVWRNTGELYWNPPCSEGCNWVAWGVAKLRYEHWAVVVYNCSVKWVINWSEAIENESLLVWLLDEPYEPNNNSNSNYFHVKIMLKYAMQPLICCSSIEKAGMAKHCLRFGKVFPQ